MKLNCIFTFTITLLCLDLLHVSAVKRPSSGGTTLADFGVSYVHCSFWLVAGCNQPKAKVHATHTKNC
jgi:hypothetical protein